jgi:hypothetical protein
VCGVEVSSVVLRVLTGEDDPTILSKMFIILIPKVPSLVELGQFRSITLCNCNLYIRSHPKFWQNV